MSKFRLILLRGGLGNQILLLTYARFMEKESGVKSKIDLSWYDQVFKNKKDTPRKISVDIDGFEVFQPSLLHKIALKMQRRFKKLSLVSSWYDDSYGFELMSQPGWVDVIREVLTKTNHYTDCMEDEICVHIRLGDYLSERYREKYLICTDDYYLAAVEKLRKISGINQYKVFTDSPEFVGKYYPKISSGSYSIESKSEADTFHHLSGSRYIVASNSTFSLVSALNSSSEEKGIVLPEKWLVENNFKLPPELKNILLC